MNDTPSVFLVTTYIADDETGEMHPAMYRAFRTREGAEKWVADNWYTVDNPSIPLPNHYDAVITHLTLHS